MDLILRVLQVSKRFVRFSTNQVFLKGNIFILCVSLLYILLQLPFLHCWFVVRVAARFCIYCRYSLALWIEPVLVVRVRVQYWLLVGDFDISGRVVHGL